MNNDIKMLPNGDFTVSHKSVEQTSPTIFHKDRKDCTCKCGMWFYHLAGCALVPESKLNEPTPTPAEIVVDKPKEPA